MEIEYDKEGLYIKISDIPDYFGIVDYSQELTDEVIVDWMKDGTLYGIDILKAWGG